VFLESRSGVIVFSSSQTKMLDVRTGMLPRNISRSLVLHADRVFLLSENKNGRISFQIALAKRYNESMELPSEHAGAQQGRVTSYRDP
jgi:hypothetical protein